MRWLVSTLPAATEAGGDAFTTLPSGRISSTWASEPPPAGISTWRSSWARHRTTYRVAEVVMAATAFTPPRTWGDEPLKSTVR